jgi:hypothetical protein
MPEALAATFESEERSYTVFMGLEAVPPLPAHLPEYITQSSHPALLTDTEDLSKVDILDFGSGPLNSPLMLDLNGN